MKTRVYRYWILVILLSGLLTLSLSAQDSTEPQEVEDREAVMARVAEAITAAQNYDSYRVNTSSRWSLDWSAESLNLGGQSATINDTNSVIIEGGDDIARSMQHTISVLRSDYDKDGAQISEYMLGSEVRAVDRQIYVDAELLAGGIPDAEQVLPDGWIIVSGRMLSDYPALSSIESYWFTSVTPLENALGRFTPEDLTATIAQFATRITRSTDANGGETIVAYLPPEAARTFGIFIATDPITQAVYGAVEGDPLEFIFSINGDGQLTLSGFVFAFDVQDVDLSESMDAPDGTQVSFNQQISTLLTFSEINAAFEPITAPDGVTIDDQLQAEPPAQNAVQNAADDLPWWNDAVFYEIFVRSFYDTDNDGIGDIQGLITQLDYLNDGDPSTTQDLGVTGIWLMPVMQSPTYHGYEVSDYTSVDIDYGTNEDFKAFIEEAHARGIKVIVDLVVNHSSARHAWFTQSARGDERYADYYIWGDSPRMPLLSPWGTFSWYQREGRFYYAIFDEFMPDLNYANPDVTQEMYDIAEFWLTEMNVDGFRIDAARHIIEQDGMNTNAPQSLTWLADFTAHVKSVKPDALVIGEVWDDSEIVAAYVPESVDIAFEFDLARALLTTAVLGRADYVQAAIQEISALYPIGQFAPFLSNHDQARVMSQLDGDESQARIAASLLLTLPGVPFVYYGEEIGMIGTKPDPRIRTPMQWDAFPLESAGFSDAPPWEPVQEDVLERNVYLQEVDPESLLSHYRGLIQARNNHKALRRGNIRFLDAGNNAIYAAVRETGDGAVLVLLNLSGDIVRDYALTLDESAVDAGALALVFGTGDLQPFTPEGWQPFDLLPPRSTALIKLR